MDQIQYDGVSDLKKAEQEVVNDLCSEYYEKVKRMLHNELILKVKIEALSKGGKPRYIVEIKAEAPTRIFEVSKDDWDIARTLHKSFNALMAEIEHTFHKKGLQE